MEQSLWSLLGPLEQSWVARPMNFLSYPLSWWGDETQGAAELEARVAHSQIRLTANRNWRGKDENDDDNNNNNNKIGPQREQKPGKTACYVPHTYIWDPMVVSVGGPASALVPLSWFQLGCIQTPNAPKEQKPTTAEMGSNRGGEQWQKTWKKMKGKMEEKHSRFHAWKVPTPLGTMCLERKSFSNSEDLGLAATHWLGLASGCGRTEMLAKSVMLYAFISAVPLTATATVTPTHGSSVSSPESGPVPFASLILIKMAPLYVRCPSGSPGRRCPQIPCSKTHLGGPNLGFHVDQYICGRKSEGIYSIHLKRTWEKLLPAAHAIFALENPGSCEHPPLQESRPASWADICCWPRSHSYCRLLHLWDLHQPDPGSLPGLSAHGRSRMISTSAESLKRPRASRCWKGSDPGGISGLERSAHLLPLPGPLNAEEEPLSGLKLLFHKGKQNGNKAGKK
ncbi:hypothetical protein GH733_001355 [Mirounga leonina]|nr:hypothetical protein GH733_001355 [Mirounga leonina]